jgi:hypothetical protein
MLPCEFEISQLSQFNRGYICRTDTNFQASKNLPPEQIDKEGIQLRVFSDKNSRPNDIPREAIALK